MVTRVYHILKNDNCSHLSKINFSKLFSLGDLYCSKQLKIYVARSGRTWLRAGHFFVKSLKIKELEEIVYCPLWKKSHVSYNGIFFIKDWYDKGIRNVMDIINENGLFRDFVEFKRRYNIQ